MCLIFLILFFTIYHANAQKTPMEMYQANHGGDVHEPKNESKVLRVVGVLVEPFLMITRDCGDPRERNASSCQGNSLYEGYLADLMKLLAEDMDDFNYEIFIDEENRYGKMDITGKWNGIIGHIVRKKADIGIGAITINKERLKTIDMSVPFMSSGISIMIRKPYPPTEPWYSFVFSPFWMHFLQGLTVGSMVFILMSQIKINRELFTSRHSFWAYKVFIVLLWILAILLVASFVGQHQIMINNGDELRGKIFEDLSDLLKHPEVKFGIQRGGSTEQFFKRNTNAVYASMWKRMVADPENMSFVNTYAEGIERARSNNFAFLLESSANNYVNTRKPCDTMKIGENLNTVFYGLATQKGSKWKGILDLALMNLQENGMLKKLENKWWYDRGQCDQPVNKSDHDYDFLEPFRTTLYILIIGFILWILMNIYKFVKDKTSGSPARLPRNVISENEKFEVDS